MTRQLLDADVDLDVDAQGESFWLILLYQCLPILLLIGVFVYFMGGMMGGAGGGRAMGFGKAKARQVNKDQPQVTFADVAGADEAVEELQEIKEFLENPAKFQAMGAKIPKGVLLFGPPGTGKTLLARAVAGEAGVPFFSISGSDFVEMFVGVGASRVRDLFEQAKATRPGHHLHRRDRRRRPPPRRRARAAVTTSASRPSTSCSSRWTASTSPTGVILIAATNRPDILDPALLRPGRFDRQIVVDQPDLDGRRAILDVHAKGKPLGPRRRPRRDRPAHARASPAPTWPTSSTRPRCSPPAAARTTISMPAVEEAIDRVMAGPERKQPGHVRQARSGSSPTTRPATPWSATCCPTPTRSTRCRSSPVAGPWAGRWPCPTRTATCKTRSELRDEMAMLHGRPHRRGDHLRRPHHRRPERHRAGHPDRPGHGHPVRHERRHRPAAARQPARRGLPRQGDGPRGQLLRRGRLRHRRRDPPPGRRGPRRGPRDPARCTGPRSTSWPTPSWPRRRSATTQLHAIFGHLDAWGPHRAGQRRPTTGRRRPDRPDAGPADVPPRARARAARLR